MLNYIDFQETVMDYYRQHGRVLPWRVEPLTGYQVLVSELMLQQTQVARVVPKYQQFLELFPNLEALARASLADVIRAWSGLGYNRRAKYLHEAAKQLVSKNEPWTIDELVACKGIGHNTAAAVRTYAYNQSIPFIETNIRTVYIYHFFPKELDVTDAQLLPIVKESLPVDYDPREFMWALMDYGSFLKGSVGNVSRMSKHYTKQSTFEGSVRQIRGSVLRLLGKKPATFLDLQQAVLDERFPAVLEQLLQEGLIQQKNKRYQLAT